MAKESPPKIVHILARVKLLRRKMRQKGFAAFLATAPADVGYLSGFTGEDSYLLVTSGRTVLITDSRFTEQARHQCRQVRIIQRSGPMGPALAGITRRIGTGKIGFEPDSMTFQAHGLLRKAVSPARLVSARRLIRSARIRKDAGEIRAVRQALKIAQDAFLAVLAWIKPGMTELEVAARLELEMTTRRSSQPAFPTIVACGPRTSMPHVQPGPGRIRPGRPILIDWGATVASYKCDLTRTFFIDTMPQSFRVAYQTVRRAGRAALKVIKPGVLARDIDAAAREVIEKAGFGQYFGHSLGHGLGRDVHEAPVIGPRSDDRIEEGMIFTVEPGIYLPGKGGIRIENDVVVTHTGCRVLSNLPDDTGWALRSPASQPQR